MILPTLATLVYTVNLYAQTGAQMAAKMSAPVVDPAFLSAFGLTLSSDSTSTVGNTVVRTIELGLNAPFFTYFPLFSDLKAPFYNLMTNAIAASCKSSVIASTPSIT